MSREAMKRTPNPLPKMNQELEETKRILQRPEANVLVDIAQVLSEVAESLARTAKELANIQSPEWLTAEQAARHLGCESVKAFEKIAAREGIPKHYLSARAPRYNRAELDAWLMGRRASIPGASCPSTGMHCQE
jgi:hypothetical protein